MSMSERTKMTLAEIDMRLGKGTIDEIRRRKNGKIRFRMYISQPMMEMDIADLDMSVRASNGLKRGGYTTVGELVTKISGFEELSRIRNLGRKSVDEIMLSLFAYQYEALAEERRERYLEDFRKLNGV